MNPFYFGSSQKPLFGVYHQPVGSEVRDEGIVLCYPFGQEYMRSHRAFRQLALLLSKRGFHVFRFDYHGTGDSGGASSDVSVSECIENVHQAVEELSEQAGVRRMSLVGLRLGGTFAAKALQKTGRLDGLVLWDPVVDGNDYYGEMLCSANATNRHSKAVKGGPNDLIGVLGFPITQSLREGIRGLNLRSQTGLPVDDVLIIASSAQRQFEELSTHLSHDTFTDYECVPSPGSWNEVDNFGGVLIPQTIIQAIVAWFVQRQVTV